MLDQIKDSVEFLQNKVKLLPETGVILGTGIGNSFVSAIQESSVIDYKDIPHFPVSTVEFHKGKLIFGRLEDKPVVAMQGRFHYYEGYSMQQITFPVRVLRGLGIKRLLISNAAGNLNNNWKKGDLMLIEDHINLQPDNPLRGVHHNDLGPRFPDMSRPYDTELNLKLSTIADEEKIVLRKGVYVSVMGPNLETRAEYRYLRQIGGDAVGMSTVPEVLVCAQMGLPCCAVSVLTDDCDPDNLQPVNIENILAIASGAEPNVTRLFRSLIRKI
jgi:purine-nucleoside phosphorylase